jgi:hypothetical protein
MIKLSKMRKTDYLVSAHTACKITDLSPIRLQGMVQIMVEEFPAETEKLLEAIAAFKAEKAALDASR